MLGSGARLKGWGRFEIRWVDPKRQEPVQKGRNGVGNSTLTCECINKGTSYPGRAHSNERRGKGKSRGLDAL